MTTKAKGATVTVGVKALREVMKFMTSVVEKRNTIALLSYVLIRSGPSTMTIVGTDLDVELRQQIDLPNSGQNESFAICVHAQSFGDIMRKLAADAQASLTVGDGKMTIVVGRSRFVLPTLPADDFPELTRHEWASQFEIDKGHLTALLSSTAFAISTDETRYYLGGIYCHVSDDMLFGAATDGHRLARFHCEAPEGTEAMPGIIIPRKTVKIVDDLLDEHDGPKVEIDLSRARIRFSIGTVELTSKLIDGQFPDYTRVIPVSNRAALWFNPKELMMAVDRVATIASDDIRLVAFDLAKDKLILRVTSPENGAATEEVPCQYDGEAMTIGFNSRYVLAVVRQLTGDNVQVMLGDPASPSLWRDDEDARRIYVLMPARV